MHFKVEKGPFARHPFLRVRIIINSSPLAKGRSKKRMGHGGTEFTEKKGNIDVKLL